MDDDPLPEDAPAPRLCHITKWKHFDGYGFNLHAEKASPGQFVGHVDPGSPSEAAGLRVGDRIVEVNGVNIGHENHRQVVARIKAVPEETRLLVMDAKTERYYRKNDIVVRGAMKNIVYLSSADSPRFSPKRISNKRELLHEIPSSQGGDLDEDDDKASVASAGSLLPPSHHTQKRGTNGGSLSGSSLCSSPSPEPSKSGAWDGLSLDLTVAEMRARIVSRRKRDPRIDPSMDLRKKLEVLNAM